MHYMLAPQRLKETHVQPHGRNRLEAGHMKCGKKHLPTKYGIVLMRYLNLQQTWKPYATVHRRGSTRHPPQQPPNTHSVVKNPRKGLVTNQQEQTRKR